MQNNVIVNHAKPGRVNVPLPFCSACPSVKAPRPKNRYVLEEYFDEFVAFLEELYISDSEDNLFFSKARNFLNPHRNFFVKHPNNKFFPRYPILYPDYSTCLCLNYPMLHLPNFKKRE